MLSRPKESPAVRRVNRAFERVATVMKVYQLACEHYGKPLRSVTYRVEDNGTSKLNVVSRKVCR